VLNTPSSLLKESMQSNFEVSKFLSYVLRHNPDKIGLALDANGWANVSELLEKAHLDMSTLQKVVATNDKKRFSFNEDETKIRANQGHSISIDLNLQPKEPPEFLYHGTAARFLDSIMKQGLVKGNRQHVHLSLNVQTATKVGQRHGNPVVLKVLSKKMHEAGYIFYLSDNGVWLTDHVSVEFLMPV
jgi:putative RNA 2'-phosphotransferase